MQGMLAVLVLLSCSSLGSAVVTITDHESRTMRREPSSEGFRLSAHGDVIRSSSMTESRDESYCNMDFPEGKVGTSECVDDSNGTASTGQQLPIPKADLCIFAATLSGFRTVHGGGQFDINQTDVENHPKGCFKDPCTDGNGTCFFFNSIATAPNGGVTVGNVTTLVGTPVCFRSKRLHGTADTNGTCPTAYTVIKNETDCRVAAGCMGHAIGSVPDFRIGTENATKHVDYPTGCFVNNDAVGADHSAVAADAEKDVVFFNGPYVDPPVNPKGIPICAVTNVNGVGDGVGDATGDALPGDAASPSPAAA